MEKLEELTIDVPKAPEHFEYVKQALINLKLIK